MQKLRGYGNKAGTYKKDPYGDNFANNFINSKLSNTSSTQGSFTQFDSNNPYNQIFMSQQKQNNSRQNYDSYSESDIESQERDKKQEKNYGFVYNIYEDPLYPKTDLRSSQSQSGENSAFSQKYQISDEEEDFQFKSPVRKNQKIIEPSLYEILGLEANATLEEIKKQYKKLVLVCHPDKGGDQFKFNQIKRAYDVLIDPKKKFVYDEKGIEGLELYEELGFADLSHMSQFQSNNQTQVSDFSSNRQSSGFYDKFIGKGFLE